MLAGLVLFGLFLVFILRDHMGIFKSLLLCCSVAFFLWLIGWIGRLFFGLSTDIVGIIQLGLLLFMALPMIFGKRNKQ